MKLAENEVHVWRVQLDSSFETMTRFQRILSSEEYIRVQRFHFEKDRHHWTISRGILRILLSLYTQQGLKDITFQVASANSRKVIDNVV